MKSGAAAQLVGALFDRGSTPRVGEEVSVVIPTRDTRAKGRIAAMTKAASYLLWRADFSKMRQYLLAHMDFMVSDSTGVPPADARAAGFVMDAYGEFSGSFLEASKAINDQFRELWSSKPATPLPFRYGYLDAGRRFHMVVTHRP